MRGRYREFSFHCPKTRHHGSSPRACSVGRVRFCEIREKRHTELLVDVCILGSDVIVRSTLAIPFITIVSLWKKRCYSRKGEAISDVCTCWQFESRRIQTLLSRRFAAGYGVDSPD